MREKKQKMRVYGKLRCTESETGSKAKTGTETENGKSKKNINGYVQL